MFLWLQWVSKSGNLLKSPKRLRFWNTLINFEDQRCYTHRLAWGHYSEWNWFEGGSSTTAPERVIQSGDCIAGNDFYPLPTLHHLLNTKPIAPKNLLTISATLASAEGSSSYLKLIKTYLRLTMSREHLSDLAKISIKCDVAVLLDYIDLINELAAVSTREVWL